VHISVTVQPMLGDVALVRRIAGSATNPDLQTAVSMRLDPDQRAAALRIVEDAAPRVFIFDIADFGTIIQQFIGNLVVLLVALASLSVFAGIVIIGNAVALAMLERRREIGILKSVGHSSVSVLSQVLVENAVVGALGAIAGMVMVTLAAKALERWVISIDLPVSAEVVAGCVAGTVALVTATAALVAWAPTRVRPLEVLRYE
jgi:ABC-type antimicrobial peptide transport system permease subunit